jgi:hypothetical protein
MVDKFPMGAVMNKGLTLRSAQHHGERYIPMLLERMASGELKTAHLANHPMPLDEGLAATTCSRTGRTAASGRCSSPDTSAGEGRSGGAGLSDLVVAGELAELAGSWWPTAWLSAADPPGFYSCLGG